MSEPKLISPLLDQFAIGSAISSHHGVSCYPAMRENSDERYIVKVISIPASQVQLEALLLSGAFPDKESAQAYFRELVTDIENETDVLRHLSKLDGFLAFEGYQFVPMEDSVGFEVYLLSKYRKSLAKHLARNPMTHLGAINLGIDLCAAMSVCRHAGCLYVDLKPDNVFITHDGKYCIGDLGFIPLSSLKFASLPDKYRSSWTAPEVVDAFSNLNMTMDIYAIGLILYQAYNNGTLPFSGDAPSDVLPAPMYADYEMAEIILKACAPNPEDRWQTPKELGNALASYMQRNGVNDTPIVPPTVSMPEEDRSIEPSEHSDDVSFPVSDDSDETFSSSDSEGRSVAPGEEELSDESFQDIPEELKFMSELNSDETSPTEETAQELENAVLTDELTDILTQANELLSHEVPAPVVAPDYIDVPAPDPIPLEQEAEQTGTQSSDDGENVPADPVEESAEQTDEPENEEQSPAKDQQTEQPSEDFPEEPVESKKSHRGLIAALITIATVLCLILGGSFFFSNYYLQNIEELVLHGNNDSLTVEVHSDIADSLLSVVCTDTYGSTKQANVVDGKANFTELKPGSQYSVQVRIDGFRKLTGDITSSYATQPLTEIISFSGIAGPEDGSVVLSFTVNGQDPEAWSAVYSTDGEEEKTVAFSGHSATVTGLSIGKDYQFILVPQGDVFLEGTTELTFKASENILAENLKITDCEEGSLTVEWNAPSNIEVESWTVRCYNESGYDQTITVNTCKAEFTGVDTSGTNTIEVLAAGMTQCARTFIGADPVRITQMSGSNTTPTELQLKWDFSGNAPENGWLLVYTLDDSTDEKVINCETNTGLISPVVPGTTYHITIQAASGTTVFNNAFSLDIPKAEPFSGYGVKAENMELSMCKTPDVENWDYTDLSNADYTSVFAVDEKASILVHLRTEYDVEYDDILIQYIIRDSSGKLISNDSQTQRWIDMWRRGYCELDVPAMPQSVGDYTMELYFNGKSIAELTFSIE